MRPIIWVMVLTTAPSLFGERASAAQLTDPAAAEALFQEGQRLLKGNQVPAACSKFDESLRLDPAIGTLLNVAACQERLGRTATAWQHWRAAADQMGTGDKRRTMAIRHATALEKVLSRLTVTLEPTIADDDQVEVRRDGLRLGRAGLGLPLPLDPGPHTVLVLAPGRQPRSYDLVIRSREARSLLVEAGAEAPAPTTLATAEGSLPGLASGAPAGSPQPDALVRTDDPASPPAMRWRTLAGWGLIGSGAVAGGIAGYFGFQALQARRDAEGACPGPASSRLCFRSGQSALDRDRRSSISADVAAVLGTVLVGGGLFLLLHRPAEVTGSSTVFLTPLPHGGQARLVTKF